MSSNHRPSPAPRQDKRSLRAIIKGLFKPTKGEIMAHRVAETIKRQRVLEKLANTDAIKIDRATDLLNMYLHSDQDPAFNNAYKVVMLLFGLYRNHKEQRHSKINNGNPVSLADHLGLPYETLENYLVAILGGIHDPKTVDPKRNLSRLAVLRGAASSEKYRYEEIIAYIALQLDNEKVHPSEIKGQQDKFDQFKLLAEHYLQGLNLTTLEMDAIIDLLIDIKSKKLEPIQQVDLAESPQYGLHESSHCRLSPLQFSPQRSDTNRQLSNQNPSYQSPTPIPTPYPPSSAHPQPQAHSAAHHQPQASQGQMPPVGMRSNRPLQTPSYIPNQPNSYSPPSGSYTPPQSAVPSYRQGATNYPPQNSGPFNIAPTAGVSHANSHTAPNTNSTLSTIENAFSSAFLHHNWQQADQSVRNMNQYDKDRAIEMNNILQDYLFRVILQGVTPQNTSIFEDVANRQNKGARTDAIDDLQSSSPGLASALGHIELDYFIQRWRNR